MERQTQNISVKIAKCICLKGKLYLSEWQNVLVQVAKYLFPNAKSKVGWVVGRLKGNTTSDSGEQKGQLKMNLSKL